MNATLLDGFTDAVLDDLYRALEGRHGLVHGRELIAKVLDAGLPSVQLGAFLEGAEWHARQTSGTSLWQLDRVDAEVAAAARYDVKIDS